MKKYILLILVVVNIVSCSSPFLKNQDTDIKIGKTYAFSFDWDDEDPFSKIEIDTVKVIAINGDYVQWQYKDGLKLSGQLKYFKHRQRPCN